MRSQTVEQVSRAELVDGSVISLRRLDSDDADDVVRLYESLTDDECYYRFFTLHPAHLQDYARFITERSNDQYCLGAFDSEKLLGVANFVACKTPGYAEVAVVIAHNQHLRGVGTALLRRLEEIAKKNGLHRLVAEVLAANYLMRRVMTDAGWPCSRHLDGSVLHVEIDLNTVNAAPRS
jgi:RimJ/RimL family protein N-acetyltransferase